MPVRVSTIRRTGAAWGEDSFAKQHLGPVSLYHSEVIVPLPVGGTNALRVGNMLYSAFEHREIGWVVGLEDEHRFEDGTVQPGVLFMSDIPPAHKQRWRARLWLWAGLLVALALTVRFYRPGRTDDALQLRWSIHDCRFGLFDRQQQLKIEVLSTLHRPARA